MTITLVRARARALLAKGLTIHQVAARTTLSPRDVADVGHSHGLILMPDTTMRAPARPEFHTPSPGRQAHGRSCAANATYPTRAVRAWARANDIPAPTRGRYLPAELVTAWRAAGAPR